MAKTTKPETDPASELLTVAHIAKQLHVDIATVRRWIADGQLRPAYRLPRGFRVPRSALDHFLGDRQVR